MFWLFGPKEVNISVNMMFLHDAGEQKLLNADKIDNLIIMLPSLTETMFDNPCEYN